MATLHMLEEFVRRDELAKELQRNERTLHRWEMLKIGPPVVRIGRLVLYRREAVLEWLRSQEAPRARKERRRSTVPRG